MMSFPSHTTYPSSTDWMVTELKTRKLPQNLKAKSSTGSTLGSYTIHHIMSGYLAMATTKHLLKNTSNPMTMFASTKYFHELLLNDFGQEGPNHRYKQPGR